MLSEAKLKALREQLEREREGIRALLADLKNPRERPSREGDEADLAQTAMERQQEMWRAEDLRNRLETVEEALANIAAGTYGLCSSCGRKIDPARLKALPHATLCLKCKQRIEESS
jgi:DnaK suppressor protein